VIRNYSDGKHLGKCKFIHYLFHSEKFYFAKSGIREVIYINSEGKQFGPGRRMYPNGDIYDGEYVEGKKHGEGIITIAREGGAKERRRYIKGHL
jgi:hypothetical protein